VSEWEDNPFLEKLAVASMSLHVGISPFLDSCPITYWMTHSKMVSWLLVLSSVAITVPKYLLALGNANHCSASTRDWKLL